MSEQSREDKIKAILAAQEKRRRQRTCPLSYFSPHAGQEKAIDALTREAICIVISHAGNRFGKTYLAAVILVCYAYGYWIFRVPGLKLTEEGDYPPRNAVPPEYWIRRPDGLPLRMPSVGICVTGLSLLKGILQNIFPYIESMIPPAVKHHPDFRVSRASQSVPSFLCFPPSLSTGGSSINFGSVEQQKSSGMAFEGQRHTHAVCDEPPSPGVFRALWRGLTDDFGRLYIPATPIGENVPWLYDEFIASGRQDTVAIAGSIWDNPFIGDREKAEFLEGGNYSKAEREAREYGSFSFLTHRAFPTWREDVHVLPEGTQIPYGWTIGMGIDPAHRRPFAIIWAAFGPNGECWVFDEWPDGPHHEMRVSPYTIRDYARIIREREARHGRRIGFRILDPRFGVAAPRIKGEVFTSIQEDFAREKLFFDCRIPGTEREEIGIGKMREMLYWDHNAPLSTINRPRLRVMNNCRNTIRAMSMSNFSAGKDPDKLDEKLTEKFKDFRDTLRYLVLYPIITPGQGRGGGYLSQDDLDNWNSPDW